jgi:uncharacterized protein YbaA (DUF1428 family)
MKRQENMERCYNALMDKKGIDEFKDMVKRQHVFLKNREMHSLSDVPLPNQLWAIKRGGGVTTLVKDYAEYLYASRAIDFYGTVKSFEFKLDYIDPDTFFSELTRLDNTLSVLAGHHRQYKGIVCINIDDWAENAADTHFTKFLDYIASNSDRLLVIFYIHTENKGVMDAVEAALSSAVRVETLTLRFPDSVELVEYVESKFMQEKGFKFTQDAKTVLCEAIEEIATGKHFKGFKTIEQLATDILYGILATDYVGCKKITEGMIAGYAKDSSYVKRTKAQTVVKKRIGFSERGV